MECVTISYHAEVLELLFLATPVGKSGLLNDIMPLQFDRGGEPCDHMSAGASQGELS